MDIYDYLKMDHEKVEHLFELFEDSKLTSRKKEIVSLIAQELLVHAHAEQETFYRRLAEHPQTNEMALHGEKEHREIEEQINRVINSKLSGKNWEKAILKLKDIVGHHIREEEGEILDRSGDLEQNSGKIRAIPILLVYSLNSQNGLSTSP